MRVCVKVKVSPVKKHIDTHTYNCKLQSVIMCKRNYPYLKKKQT